MKGHKLQGNLTIHRILIKEKTWYKSTTAVCKPLTDTGDDKKIPGSSYQAMR
jgi:hypothetical protein